MSTVAELLVRISGDSSDLRKELNASKRQLSRLQKDMPSLVPEGAGTAVTALGVAMGAAAVKAVSMSAAMEQNRIAFTTMLGSAQAANGFLEQLQDFAAKTPFTFEGLVTGSKRMLAMGFSAQEILPTLTSLGDAMAAVGGSPERLDNVILAFSQMKAKGMLSAQEMNAIADNGIPAWELLAKTIGTDVPTAMKLAENKSIEANAAIAGMLQQMSSKYGGMMQQQANTVSGQLSNIKDNTQRIMTDVGDQITKAFDLKTKLASASAEMARFADSVKANGLGETMANLIPDSVIVASMTAITAYSAARFIPAMAAISNALLEARIAALAFNTALGPIGWAITGTVLVLGSFGMALRNARGDLEAMPLEDVSMQMIDFGNSTNYAAKQLSALRGMADFKRSEDTNTMPAIMPQVEAPSFAGLLDGVGGGGGSDEAEDALKDLQKEAERVHEAIRDEWVQTTHTELQQLDIWRDTQLQELEDSKDANEDYETDKERIAAVYSVRRLKILQDEASKARDIGATIRDAWKDLQGANSFTGNKADLVEMERAHQDATDAIADKWDRLAEQYATASESEKTVFIKNLEERGVAYEKLGDDQIAFEANKMAEISALDERYEQEKRNRHQTTKDIQADIDAAYAANSMSMLQQALTAENAERLNDYEAQKSMMETYQEAFLAAHSTTAQLVSDLYAGAFSGLKSAMSDILTGTASIKSAFSDLGNTMVKIVADYVASWIAGRLMMAIFGDQSGGKQLGQSTAQGAATAAAWAPAAAMVSLATFGANAGPAMAGMAMTNIAAMGMAAIPALANGGMATGPTLAMIGEGRYNEAVVPLNDKVYGKLAGGIDSAMAGKSSGSSYNVTIQAWDGDSVDKWLNKRGGASKIIKGLKKAHSQFEQ